jgi:hypothetical protein
VACQKEAPPAPPPPPEQPASQPSSRPDDIPASQPDLDVGKAEAHEPSDKKNQISYKDPRCSGIQPCECSGTIVYGQNAIAKIGLTEADLAAGTPCLLGDFDGNGHQDVAFVEKSFGKAAAGVQVLLFDELGLRDTPAFPKKVNALAIHTKDGKVGLLETTSRLFFRYQDGKFEMERI